MKETKKVCDEIDFIVYFLLLFYMLVDCITGLFGMYGIPGISQPYKMMRMTKNLGENMSAFDFCSYSKNLAVFKNKVGSFDDGHASERIIEWIRENKDN